MKRNYFKAPIDRMWFYIILGTAVFVGVFLSSAALTKVGPYVLMITSAFLVTTIYALGIWIRDIKLDQRMDRYMATQVVDFMLEGPVKAQISQVITDWRKRKTVFPNQILILREYLERLYDQNQVAGHSTYDLLQKIDYVVKETEEKKYGNVILFPPTLEIHFNKSEPEILISGQIQEYHRSQFQF